MKSHLKIILSVALFLGAVAVVSIPVLQSMLSHETELTIFQSSGVLKSYNPKGTLSVDFPNENAGTICKSLADLFEIAIHVPIELASKEVTVKLIDVTVVKLLEAMFPEEGVQVRYDGSNIYVTLRPSPKVYPRVVAAFSRTEKSFGITGLVAAVVFFGSLFWQRHVQQLSFDLWKSLGLVFVLAGFWSVLNWNDVTGAKSLWDFFKPLNAWFIFTGIGLWLRFPWARYLGLIVGWGGIVVLLAAAIMDGDVVTIPFVIGKLLPVIAILALLHSVKRKIGPGCSV